METADFNALFEDILRDFSLCRRQAKETGGPDDVYVRIAAIGFARTAPGHQWGAGQAEIIRKLSEHEYSDEMLDWYDASRETVALFVSLCYGAMLGLDAVGRLTENDRKVGERALPGFIMSRLSDT
jgi:hypothetical protein